MTPSSPVLVAAIETTLRAMERRLWLYRNLVVAVSLTVLGSVAAALVFRQWLALTGILALPVYVGVFLELDRRLVRAWRREVKDMCDLRGLDVAQLGKTLGAFRYIPPQTLRSMLASLSSDAGQR